MRVGIDASNIRVGGGITHLVELLRAANPQTHKFDEVVVWASTSTLNKIEDRRWLRKEHDPLLDRTLPFRVYWQRARLAKCIASTGCDVLFVPGGSEASKFRPMITMSRNLLPFEWQEMRRYGLTWLTLKNVLLRFAQTRTFRRAEGLIFLTHYARKVVMKNVGKNRGKVAVISHGVDQSFFCTPRTQRPITEYTVEAPFRLLYVSIVDAYKHQWHLAEAVAKLRATGFPVTLDLVGPEYAPAMERLRETLKRVDPDGKFVRYLGAVPHKQLHQLYASADLNVFASSCENMPNILLEGMASGLPIACSNRGPMNEILGDAGVYFDPENPNEIADAIGSLLVSADVRLQKAQAAFQRAQQFSWAWCATETLGFLAEVSQARGHQSDVV